MATGRQVNCNGTVTCQVFNFTEVIFIRPVFIQTGDLMIARDYEKDGLIYFTKRRNGGTGSDISNTYALKSGDQWYIIDTSCGTDRCKEINKFLREKKTAAVLCTHYHNDHIANNGRTAETDVKIIYHHLASLKTTNLRTNATGQILTMYRLLDKRGMLARMGYFSGTFIRFMLSSRFTAEYVMPPMLYVMSYLFSLFGAGWIYSGRSRISFLREDEKRRFSFSGAEFDGWIISDGLYALETPGHTDCHIAFYFRDSKILFSGDLLNFLTPNDIQFGDLDRALESQKNILSLAVNDSVKVLCQGHYEPVSGNTGIVEYISDIISKHEYVKKTILACISNAEFDHTFDELYNKILKINDPVIEKLARITFPRSTLVFLDVYLYKLLSSIRDKAGYK